MMETRSIDRTNLLARYDEQLRINMEYPEARKEVTNDVVRFTRRAPGMSFVSFTFSRDDDLDRVIVEQIEYFDANGFPFAWKVFEHDQRPVLQQKLALRGLRCDNSDPGEIMVLSLNEVSPLLLEPVRADIRRVQEAEGLKDVVYVLDQVYGNDNTWVYDRLGSHLQIPGYLSVYLTYVDSQPASVAWTYFPKGDFALLFAGSTIPAYRKQGLYTSLLAVRLQEMRERSYQVAVVEAGTMSRPIVARHGFRYLTTLYDYEWKKKLT